MYDREDTGRSLKLSRVLPMKRTVAPAEGERTNCVAVREERVCGVREMWIVGVSLITASVGMAGL